MKDIGRKMETAPIASDEGKSEKYYPTISIDNKQLPELNEIKVGDSISLKVAGKVKGIRMEKNSASYEIEIKACEIGDKMSEKDYLDMTDDEKDDYDGKDLEKKED